MSRAVLLPTPGDPFLLAYWLRNFETWGSLVDELHVLIDGNTDEQILDWLESEIHFACERAGVHSSVLLRPDRIDHGVGLALLMDQTDADVVMLAEDDAWVRRPSTVESCFLQIEAGDHDVIGSPRGSASHEIMLAAAKLWPEIPQTDTLDAGHGLWPTFLFARRADLLATDRRYGARLWEPGELVPGIRKRFDLQVSADTFGSTAYQLRAAGLEIHPAASYRLGAHGSFAGWLPRDPPWFHVGSLSTGYGYAFADSTGRCLLEIAVDSTPPVEWGRRFWWWRHVWLKADPRGLPDEHARYGAAIADAAARAGANPDAWEGQFAGWENW